MNILQLRGERAKPEQARDEEIDRRALEILERRRCDWVEAWARAAEEQDILDKHGQNEDSAQVRHRSGRVRRAPGRVTLSEQIGRARPPDPHMVVAPGRTTLATALPAAVMRSAERADVDPSAAELIARARRGGAPLDGVLRPLLEAALGARLDGVRVHTGVDADAAAHALGARAFAIGDDVFFRDGAYDPQRRDGQRLLAHEVAHTVQARGATLPASGTTVSQPGDAIEREADAFADAFADRAAQADSVPARAWLDPFRVHLGDDQAASQERTHALGPAPRTIHARTHHPDIAHDGPLPSLSAAQAAIFRQVAPPARASGDLRDPRQFPTYEEFLAAFRELGTFTARDTPGTARTRFQVLGDRAADDSSADAADHGVTRRGTRPGEAYIDHPTADWVASHLPSELRMAVYELPADCADVAVLLRHVWLYARGRTERYGAWVIGAGAGRTEARRASHLTRLIRDQVYSGSVRGMIGVPYQSRSFAVLEALLHPGDVLVWEHHDPTTHRRSGGHTQTIQTVARDGRGHITSITLLQGNQPLSPSTPEVPGQTPEIPGQTPEIQADQRAHHQPVSAESTLRALPGRRIERDVLSGRDLQDVGGVWTWNDRQATSLVAAGPPSGVTRPATRRIHGERRRRVSDWGPSLRAATAATIEGVFEAFLFEVRAGLEGASAQAAEIRREAPDVAAIAGRRLTRLRISATRRQELGTMLVAQARSTGTHLNPGTGTEDRDVFTAIGDGVRDAAGITETTAPAEE